MPARKPPANPPSRAHWCPKAPRPPSPRPPYEPTAKDRTMVRLLCAGGITQDRISVAIGISDRTLRKHYKRDILVGATEIDAQAVATLVGAMRSSGKGGVAAAKWWTQSRMGWVEKILVDDGKPADTPYASSLSSLARQHQAASYRHPETDPAYWTPKSTGEADSRASSSSAFGYSPRASSIIRATPRPAVLRAANLFRSPRDNHQGVVRQRACLRMLRRWHQITGVSRCTRSLRPDRRGLHHRRRLSPEMAMGAGLRRNARDTCQVLQRRPEYRHCA
jgi:hypothetical protein